MFEIITSEFGEGQEVGGPFAVPRKQYHSHQKKDKINSLVSYVLRLSLIKARKGREK